MKIILALYLILLGQISIAQLRPTDTIRKIEVTFHTSNDILSGTNNDVWFDIGPKAWRISDGFEKGGIKRFIIDDPSRLTIGSSASTEEIVPLIVSDIKLIRIEKKGIRLCDIRPDINTVLKAFGTDIYVTKWEDSLMLLTMCFRYQTPTL